jgi:hypothetical protein
MKHNKLAIFEGTMCCDSGVCGAEPDVILVEFGDTLKKLKNDFPDLVIQRANMSHSLDVFRQNMDVLMMIKKEGIGILPMIQIDGVVFSKKRYPKYAELKKALEA